MMRALLFLFCLTLFTPAFAHGESVEETFEGTVTHVQPGYCEDGRNECSIITIERMAYGHREALLSITQDPRDALGGTPEAYREGDKVIIQSQVTNGETVAYFISDRVRRPALGWLVGLFVGMVFVFGGWNALRSFGGLIASLLVLFLFIVPSILKGYSPLIIAISGSAIIMFITFFLSHGWNRKTIAALAGTAGSLLITALLAMGFSVYAHIAGTADEEMLFLLSDYPLLRTQGILLAGIIIGTLGVLDDITISQASAVFELRKANSSLSLKELYVRAKRIGADHIAAAINTLILAYAGTTLPLLLLVAASPSGETWWTFLNREVIATEIVRTLAGSIGLLAAVPLTTFIAAWFAVRTPVEDLRHDHKGHHH